MSIIDAAPLQTVNDKIVHQLDEIFARNPIDANHADSIKNAILSLVHRATNTDSDIVERIAVPTETNHLHPNLLHIPNHVKRSMGSNIGLHDVQSLAGQSKQFHAVDEHDSIVLDGKCGDVE